METQPPKEHCQNGRADICLAGSVDGICCAEHECDIDTGMRSDPLSRSPTCSTDQGSPTPEEYTKTMYEEEIDSGRDRITELENALSDIYAMRGEDEYISNVVKEVGL